MNIVNLTPHPINLHLGGAITVIPASGQVARVTQVNAGQLQAPVTINGSPLPVLAAPVFGDVQGLPAPQDGTVYLVSLLCLEKCKGRSDVYAPATGPADGAVRDAQGKIVGVTKLVAAPAA